MAKKSRRARRRAKATETAPAGTGTAAQRTPETSTGGLAGDSALDLAKQYTYVYDDLKRIALIAGVLLVGLIALSLVIH